MCDRGRSKKRIIIRHHLKCIASLLTGGLFLVNVTSHLYKQWPPFKKGRKHVFKLVPILPELLASDRKLSIAPVPRYLW